MYDPTLYGSEVVTPESRGRDLEGPDFKSIALIYFQAAQILTYKYNQQKLKYKCDEDSGVQTFSLRWGHIRWIGRQLGARHNLRDI